MFASHYAGGFYAAANLEWPLERQRTVFKSFKPDAVIFDSSQVSLPDEMSGLAIEIDLSKLPNEKLTSPNLAHDLAYVMFTSGSTGDPKGVMISQEGLANYVDWAIQEMALIREDRWSQHPNIAFDLSVLDIYGALCSGGSLHPLISTTDRMLPARFIRDRQLTVWNSVPSVIDIMRAAREVTSKNFSSLRLLSFCGEPLLPEHVAAIFEAKPDVDVHNTYGPTEATVSCTLLRLYRDTYRSASRRSMAFGEPIQNMSLHLMGGSTADEGEIFLFGPQIARGYWNAQEQTNDVFVEIEIDGIPTPLYRTGDWGIREDGHNYFVSRIDRQIKIRGHRVELGEIDKAARDAGVRTACTVLVDQALYCFLEGDGLIDIPLLREQMENVLPAYAMPSSFKQIESLPRNANEKIDANSLIERVKNG
jgi:D-alanine--poly(phosphoribitol) ligase subunit 1